MTEAFRITAPGNILLLGEYAVTEPGGLGLALGTGPRGVLAAEPAATFTVRAKMGSQMVQWPEQAIPLVNAGVEVMCERRMKLPKLSITLDTSAFFGAGRKLGFGSSASAAVLLAAAMVTPTLPHETGFASILELALAIHRRLQDGRGSGYDVAASTFGGLLRFSGGTRPAPEPVELPWIPPLYALPAAEAVATKGAIRSYTRWKRDHPHEATDFLRRSNETVDLFLQSDSWAEAKPMLLRAKALGEELGNAIGVPADFRLSRDAEADAVERNGSVAKAVGAGGEMGVLFAADETALREVKESAVKLNLRERGVSWE